MVRKKRVRVEDYVGKKVKKHESIYVHVKKRTLQGIACMIPALIPLLVLFCVVGSLAYFDKFVYENPDDKESPLLDLMGEATPTNGQFSGTVHINISMAWMTFYIVVFTILLICGLGGAVILPIVVASFFFCEKDDDEDDD